MAVTWPRLVLFLGVVTLIAAGMGAFSAHWLLSRYSAHVPLDGQLLRVSMPTNLPVRVEVISAGAIGEELAGASARGVPVRLQETLHLRASLDTRVPLKLNVRYKGELPIRTVLPLDTRVTTRVLGLEIELPIRGEIPLDLRLPIDLTIPIDQDMRLAFTTPIKAHIDQVVHIPLRAALKTRIHFEDAHIPIVVQGSELGLPLNSLWLSGPAPLGQGQTQLGPIDSAPVDDPAAAGSRR